MTTGRGEGHGHVRAGRSQHAAVSGDTEAAASELQPSAAELKSSLEQTQQQAAEYLDLLQRVRADFVNFKRRAEQERSEQARFASADLVHRLLPVLDDLDRAVNTLDEAQAGQGWAQGVLMVQRKLRATLGEEGLAEIAATGEEFDPNFHEAVTYDEGTGTGKDVVVAVVQNGYKLHDKVIRPTLVRVGKREEGETEAVGPKVPDQPARQGVNKNKNER